MRLVQERDGVVEITWTWLPFWLATNPALKSTIEEELHTAVFLGGLTPSDADLDAAHDFVVRRFTEIFPGFSGLREFLDGLRQIQQDESA